MAVIKYKDPTTGKYVSLSLLADLIEVVDGLDSTNKASALSANSGRILNEKFANYVPLEGNAGSASKLLTPRKINGVSFDGTEDITITAEAGEHNHGLLHSSLAVMLENTTEDGGWAMFNSSYQGFILKSVRFNGASPAWGVGDYGAGVVFGGADTKGLVSVAYGSPKVKIAGGNGTGPKWWIGFTGTSGTTYNLDSMINRVPLSGGTMTGTLKFSDNVGISATCGGGTDSWGIVGGGSGDNGYCEIFTTDNGNEPILVRQYNAGNLSRTAYLLDGAGNTSFPGWLTANGFISSFASETWIRGVSSAVLNGQYTGYGAILNMPTISGRVSISTYPANDNCVYFGYASNSQISAGTNAFNTKMVWDAPNNSLSATTFIGNLSGNASSATSDNTGRSITGGYARAGTLDSVDWNDVGGKLYRSGLYTLTKTDGSWFNVINVRHRNGDGDGTGYGMQIVSTLTSSNKLVEYRKNTSSGAWTSWTCFCYSDDESVRNLYMNSISTWNAYYGNYPGGTIMFCWE